MKRIYKNNDLTFNLSINDFPYKPELIDTVEFKFYTVNRNNCIKKSKADIKDGAIILEWSEMANFEQGVLNFSYNLGINDTELGDKSHNSVVESITDYFIVTGIDPIEIETDITNWGDIQGELVNQKDLVDYINIKLDNIDLTPYALKTDLPTKNSQLENDSKYLVAKDIEGKLDKSVYDTEKLTFADKDTTNSELGKKADKTYVDDELSKKAATTYVIEELGKKVDKVIGKGLSTNDYTNEEKAKLESLQNYDDTQIKADIAKKQDTLVSGTNIKTINSESLLGQGDIEIDIYNSATNIYGNTGFVDWKGLKEIGWSDKDILSLKQYGVDWNTDAEDKANKVPQADKDLLPMDKSKIRSNNTTLTYCPIIDTKGENNLANLFYQCSKLKSIPQLNTSQVKFMQGMFYECSNILSIPKINTSSVINMESMFYKCSKLQYVPYLDTKLVQNMSQMFLDCKSLTKIKDLDLGSAINTTKMFQGCNNLRTLDNCSNIFPQNMDDMFGFCENLESIPLGLNTYRTTSMIRSFQNCKKIETIPKIGTKNVVKMDMTFAGCENLTTLTSLSAYNVKSMNEIFSGCIRLTNFEGFSNLHCDLDVSACKLLTHESLVNIINGMNRADGKVLTLGRNIYKLTDAEKKMATDIGWTLK